MLTVSECPCGRVGTLRDGRCVACRVDAGIGQPIPRPTVAELLGRLVAELEADEVIDLLAQRFTLAGIWPDLARHAEREGWDFGRIAPLAKAVAPDRHLAPQGGAAIIDFRPHFIERQAAAATSATNTDRFGSSFHPAGILPTGGGFTLPLPPV